MSWAAQRRRDWLDRFDAMVRVGKPGLPERGMAAARETALASFADGTIADDPAVRAAIPALGQTDRAKVGSPDPNASSARCAAAVQRQARPGSARLVSRPSVAARQNRLTAQFRPPKHAWRSPRLRPRDLSLSIGVVEAAVTDQSGACAPNRRRAVGRAGVCAVESMLAARRGRIRQSYARSTFVTSCGKQTQACNDGNRKLFHDLLHLVPLLTR